MRWAKNLFHLILLDHISLKITKKNKENITDEIKGITKKKCKYGFDTDSLGVRTLIHKSMALPSDSLSQPAISALCL